MDNKRTDPNGDESPHRRPDMALFRKLNQLKTDHPDEVKEIDHLLSSLQNTTVELKRVLQSLEPGQRRLLSVLVSRGIHRTVREVLVEESVDQEL